MGAGWRGGALAGTRAGDGGGSNGGVAGLAGRSHRVGSLDRSTGRLNTANKNKKGKSNVTKEANLKAKIDGMMITINTTLEVRQSTCARVGVISGLGCEKLVCCCTC